MADEDSQQDCNLTGMDIGDAEANSTHLLGI